MWKEIDIWTRDISITKPLGPTDYTGSYTSFCFIYLVVKEENEGKAGGYHLELPTRALYNS